VGQAEEDFQQKRHVGSHQSDQKLKERSYQDQTSISFDGTNKPKDHKL
jgi:hypothetical protein